MMFFHCNANSAVSVVEHECGMKQNLYGEKMVLKPDEGEVYLGLKVKVHEGRQFSVFPVWKGGVNAKSFGLNKANFANNIKNRMACRICDERELEECERDLFAKMGRLGFSGKRILSRHESHLRKPSIVMRKTILVCRR